MLSHQDARALICEGFRRCYGVDPSRVQAQLAQAVGFLETSYGSGWSNKIPGAATSNNWGAVTAGGEWTGPTFEHRDSRPDDHGNNIWYSTKFRSYASPQDGATDLIKIVYVQRPSVFAAGLSGDSLAFSTALYRTHYYLGFGATDEQRIAHHHGAVLHAIGLQCQALGEPPPDVAKPLPVIAPALLIGARGPAVSAWQRVIGAQQDGVFGPATEAATRAWQLLHKLPSTGIVTMADLIEAGLATGAKP
jgi:peptidoglycan hydrolase-like protein with peptidoglycan-binding domain